jgi:hypothetical protein
LRQQEQIQILEDMINNDDFVNDDSTNDIIDERLFEINYDEPQIANNNHTKRNKYTNKNKKRKHISKCARRKKRAMSKKRRNRIHIKNH